MTFQIFLPVVEAAATEAIPIPAKPKPAGGTETILLVEDELAVLKATRKFLARHGYTVLEAANGQEALALWETHRAAVALQLNNAAGAAEDGGWSGQELARRLQGEAAGLKVIFASGYSAEIAGKDFQLHPGEAFIQKPFATDHLLETIRRCLDA